MWALAPVVRTTPTIPSWVEVWFVLLNQCTVIYETVSRSYWGTAGENCWACSEEREIAHRSHGSKQEFRLRRNRDRMGIPFPNLDLARGKGRIQGTLTNEKRTLIYG